MRTRTYLTLIAVPLAAAALGGSGFAAIAGPTAKPARDEPLVDAFQQITRSTQWQLVDRIPLEFETYHPQGLVAVGDRLFMSSVEVLEAPVRYPEPIDGYDRTSAVSSSTGSPTTYTA